MGFADHGVAGDAATNARSDVASRMALGVELLEQLNIALDGPWIDVSQDVPREIESIPCRREPPPCAGHAKLNWNALLPCG